MTNKEQDNVKCTRCLNIFNKEKGKIELHPLYRKQYYCNYCMGISLSNTNILHRISNLLSKLDKMKIINTYTIQKKDINARKQYTLISFKLKGFYNTFDSNN